MYHICTFFSPEGVYIYIYTHLDIKSLIIRKFGHQKSKKKSEKEI